MSNTAVNRNGDFLLQWENGNDDGEIYAQNPRGSCDSVYKRGDYIMTYNLFWDISDFAKP